MNKDELLNELYKLKRFEVSVGVLDFMSKTAVKFNHVLALVDQLDEPEKVVIPQFVADAFDYKKRTCHQVDESKDIPLTLQFAFGNRGVDEFLDWVRGNPEDYVMAVRNGYEIEKESLYYVIIPTKDLKWKYYYLDNDGGIGMTDDRLSITHHTESFIRSVSDELWPFAEPVEETP